MKLTYYTDEVGNRFAWCNDVLFRVSWHWGEIDRLVDIEELS